MQIEICSENNTDSVVVVETETDFVREMHKTRIKSHRNSRKTLLPSKYNVVNSVILLESWINDSD